MMDWVGGSATPRLFDFDSVNVRITIAVNSSRMLMTHSDGGNKFEVENHHRVDVLQPPLLRACTSRSGTQASRIKPGSNIIMYEFEFSFGAGEGEWNGYQYTGKRQYLVIM